MAFKLSPAVSRGRNISFGRLTSASFARGARTGAVIQIHGVPEAIRKMGLVGAVAGRELGLVVRRSAFDVRDTARELVHSPSNPWEGRSDDYELTGHLQRGIEVSSQGGRAGALGTYTQSVSASSRAGGSDREYAAFEELGTSQNPAHPYLRPAVSPQTKKTILMLKGVASTLKRL